VPSFMRRKGGIIKELHPEEIFLTSRQNFQFHLLREEKRGEVEAWVIDVAPKELRTWQRIVVWVDQGTLEVVRIEAESPANPSVLVKSTRLATDFVQVTDGIWLPGRARTEVEGRALFAGTRIEAVTRFTHYRLNEGIDGRVFAR
ncbi:MAG: outer membrane lipoprotein-sorting protein, partial [Nitrospinae bacterium]|nr:outer membrane lipoprotein-sorting protein [Nitrospinota bacterium]